jgi:hypothetical protein
MSYETWYFIKDNILYEHYENDGHTALRRGLEARNVPLCTVEEAKIKYPEVIAKLESEHAVR